MPLPPLVAPAAPLTAEQARRFSRQIILPQIGEIGQRRLLAARVCVIGAGGLGAPALLYLAAAGVGTLGIIDDDVVETSNLQRQIIHGESDIGRRKTVSAAESITRLSASVHLRIHSERLTPSNVHSILSEYDLVLDGSDNFATRYLVADSCAELGLPLVWGSILRFDAQVSVFWSTPPASSGVPGVQLRDLFAIQPSDAGAESCASAGVLGPLCGQVGSIMAAEAVKLITGIGQPLIGRVLVLDALTARWSEVPLFPSGRTSSEEELFSARASAMEATKAASHVLSPTMLESRLRARTRGTDNFLLIDVRAPAEHAAGAIEHSLPRPLSELLTEIGRRSLPRTTPVILYCQVGFRSQQAADALNADGFDAVAVLDGGFTAWSRMHADTHAVSAR